MATSTSNTPRKASHQTHGTSIELLMERTGVRDSTSSSVRGSMTPRPKGSKLMMAAEKTPRSAELNPKTRTPRNAQRTPGKDDAFEFSAPRFHDFSKEEHNPWEDDADTWFDARLGSPNVDPSFLENAGLSLSKSLPKTPISAVTKKPLTLKDTNFGSPARVSSKVVHAPSSGEKFDKASAPNKLDEDAVAEKFKALSMKTTTAFRLKTENAVDKENSVSKKPESAKRKERPNESQTNRPPIAKAAELASHKRSVSNPTTQKPHTKSLTVPVEFSFLKRDKSNQVSEKPKNVVPERKAVRKKPASLTVPKPFRLHSTSKKVHFSAQANDKRSPYVSLAVKVKKFETATPDRFKTKPTAIPKHVTHSFKLTKPRSPRLVTKHRTKSFQQVKSTEELEAEEISRIQPFKARPVDKKILTGGPVGVPTVERPPLTIPQSPHIKKPAPPPPAPPSPPRIIKANPVRSVAVPFEPVLEHKITIPEDIKLPGDEIRARKLQEFEARLKMEEEEARRMREFHAQPMRDPNVVDPWPEVEMKPITEPVPFVFETEQKRAAAQQHQQHLEHPPRFNKYEALFVAQPMPKFDEVFVPKKSDRPATVPEFIMLHTEERADQRRHFDEQIHEKEMMEEEARRRLQAQIEAEEQERMKMHRKALVHQAQPIKQYPAMQIHPSDKPLTEPESPMLKEKRERLAKMNAAQMRPLADDGSHRFSNWIGNDGELVNSTTTALPPAPAAPVFHPRG